MTTTPTNHDRAAAWMQTYTGRAFTPLAPRAEDIDLLDIAHALSNQCRFAGHTNRFYSVAEHSVYVSRVVPSHLATLALLHDAAEAYCVDVPRPIKPHLVGYDDIETAVMNAVCARFRLAHFAHDYSAPRDWPIIKAADDAVLAAERDQIMGPAPREWAPLPEPPAGLYIAAVPPAHAKELFLDRARELGVC